MANVNESLGVARVENKIIAVRVAPDLRLGVAAQLNKRLPVQIMQDPVRMLTVKR